MIRTPGNPIRRLLKPMEKAALDKTDWKPLVNKLTRVFNKYIRFRDTPGGFGKCISCGKPISREKCHASHYLAGGKRYWATRWADRNVHASCIRCNAFEEGNKGPYLEALKKMYGNDIEDALRIMNKLYPKRPGSFALLNLIADYESRLEDMT